MRVLLVDHEDSYTYNLAHLIAACVGELPVIARHDDAQLLTLAAQAESIVLSPGPGTPLHARDAGHTLEVIRASTQPLLGVCLGHQLLAYAYGAAIAEARAPTHGYTSPITHAGEALFAGLPQPLVAMRYHSLAVRELPACLRATAHTADGEIMALAHRERPHYGVQFHPESIGTAEGQALMTNFFALAGITRAAPAAAATRALSPATPVPLEPCAWQDPHVAFAQHFLHQENAFLLSGTQRFAYAGCGAVVHPTWQDLARPARAQSGPAPFTSGLVGLLPYDTQPHRFIRPTALMIFDRETQQAWRSGALPTPTPISTRSPTQTVLADMSESDYRARIAECQAAIRAGEAYELCLTRQVRGTTSRSHWAIFEALWATNPAPHSAFFKFGDAALVAASPELFLAVHEGRAHTSPIKGTRARGETHVEDEALRHDLATHPKDRAENVMIVDVARHDLGSVASAVAVSELCVVKTFPTVHQLVSTVTATLRPEITAADAARALFPPASMTGAPKARAREWLARIEKAPRGVYAGAYGWFSDSGDCELAVTIRSLWLESERVTFGVGGAILLHSDPASEWQETESKARASRRALEDA